MLGSINETKQKVKRGGHETEEEEEDKLKR
jgi:hypothetical protein